LATTFAHHADLTRDFHGFLMICDRSSGSAPGWAAGRVTG
jgi:hypothetical protein